MITNRRRQASALLWTAQGILAALFVFAGAMKLAMPIEALARQSGLPGGLLRFVGIAELTGGLGLVLPGLLRIQRQLTPLAAFGLVLVMVGAVGVSVQRMGLGAGVFPFVVGLLLVAIARGRRDWAWRAASALGEPPVQNRVALS
jgi:uncharacterized membrane protein YphA (DoxX/SURF4 family)